MRTATRHSHASRSPAAFCRSWLRLHGCKLNPGEVSTRRVRVTRRGQDFYIDYASFLIAGMGLVERSQSAVVSPRTYSVMVRKPRRVWRHTRRGRHRARRAPPTPSARTKSCTSSRASRSSCAASTSNTARECEQTATRVATHASRSQEPCAGALRSRDADGHGGRVDAPTTGCTSPPLLPLVVATRSRYCVPLLARCRVCNE